MMKLKVLAFLMIIVLGGFLGSPVRVDSSGAFGTLEKQGLGKTQGDVESELVPFVNKALAFITGMAAVWLLFRIVWSGIRIIQNAKSPEEFYTHTKKIMWAAIGMVIVALAYALTKWVLKVMGIDGGVIDDPIKQLTS